MATGQQRDRRLALAIAGIALALIAVRLTLLQGVVSVVRIEGGSMAPSLLGEHVVLACPHCDHRWNCDLAPWQDQPRAACPLCGTAVDAAQELSRNQGTPVIIDRAKYLLESPQRFDVVAFRTADQTLAVKRVVALPGEAWEIRRGELYVDDKLVRKNHSQFRETAVLVSVGNRHWKRRVEGDTAWLVYEPTANYPARSAKPAPLRDIDSYNPATVRELNPVVDVLAECELEGDSPAVNLRVHDGFNWFTLRFDNVAGEVALLRGEQELKRQPIPRVYGRFLRLGWGLCDRQIWFLVNGDLVLEHALEQTTLTSKPSHRPIALQATDARPHALRPIALYRDIYYLDERGLGRDWKPANALAADEFAVLGDNPPLSLDTRHAEPVKRSQILGEVFQRR